MVVRQQSCPQVLTSRTYVHPILCIEYKWQERSSMIEAVIYLLQRMGLVVITCGGLQCIRKLLELCY